VALYALLTTLKQVKFVNDDKYKVWMCIICGWIYEEEKGAPEEGLEPGTRWKDVPEFWVCPDCGAGKDDFEMIEL
jgi:rubredoxin-NAD+ reductase